MAIPRLSSGVLAVLAIAALVFAVAISTVQAKPMPSAPSPAPAPGHSCNDGTAVDQGIACVLMLVALVLTYLIHSADIPDF